MPTSLTQFKTVFIQFYLKLNSSLSGEKSNEFGCMLFMTNAESFVPVLCLKIDMSVNVKQFMETKGNQVNAVAAIVEEIVLKLSSNSPMIFENIHTVAYKPVAGQRPRK
jgi:hypothetical protein